jgi:hypothetical protein
MPANAVDVELLERKPAPAQAPRSRARQGVAVPVLAGKPRASWKPPRMRPAMVGGFDPGGTTPVGGLCPLGRVARWTFVARGGGWTGSLAKARLFPFTPMGDRAAGEAAKRLRDRNCPGAVAFTLRVVVTGEWGHPEEVVEAWRLEGEPAPRNKRGRQAP